MSAKSTSPDPSEPVDAEFEPAPDSAAKTPPRKTGGGRWLALVGVAVLAAGVGGGTGWLMGRYSPLSDSADSAALAARLEALEAAQADPAQIAALQGRLEGVEETVAGQDQRVAAFEQLIRDVAALRDRIAALESQPAPEGSAVTPNDPAALEALRTRLDDVLEGFNARLIAAEDAAAQARGSADAAQSALTQMMASGTPDSASAGVDEAALAAVRTELTRLGQTVRALTADVRALEASRPQAAPGFDAGALETRLTALEDALASAEASVSASRTQGAASTSLARRALAFSALAEAAATDQPFAMEYAMLSQIWPDAPGLRALTPAARSGALTVTRLADRFPGEAVRQAAGETELFLGVIRLSRPGDADGAAARIEALLAEGDLAGAVDAVQSLEGAAAEAVSGWLTDARARLVLKEALDEMRSALDQEAAEGGAR